MTLVQDLEVGLIHRSDFARRQWLSATTKWYYHRPGRPRASRVRSGFYELIDPSLREPCLMLHKAGLGTLPSCEGHFHDRAYFADVWETLEREQEVIRDHGLVLDDSETSERLLFRNAKYVLPWRSFIAFHEELTRTQPGGYLGVAVRPEHRHIAREICRNPYQETDSSISLERPRPGFWIAAVFVDPRSPEHGVRDWQKVANYFHHVLRTPARRPVLSAPHTLPHPPLHAAAQHTMS